MKQTPWTFNHNNPWKSKNPFVKAFREFQAFRDFNKALNIKPKEKEDIDDRSSLFKAYEGHPTSFRSLEGDIGVKDIPVSSTAIEDVHFDPEHNTTTIRFKGGDTEYTYNTSEKDMMEFINAGSKGRLVAKKWNHNPRYYKKT